MKNPLTTLCYIEHGDYYLMMHRVKKKNDENQDKWIGVGGHFEEGESPEECLLREVKEETGLVLTSWRFRGLVTFVSDLWGVEYMCLYTADYPEDLKQESTEDRIGSSGTDGIAGLPELPECREGELVWVPKAEVERLNIWEGDKIFLRLMVQEAPFFSLKLRYEGDRLMEAVLNGNEEVTV